jgi:hypothetical protein
MKSHQQLSSSQPGIGNLESVSSSMKAHQRNIISATEKK